MSSGSPEETELQPGPRPVGQKTEQLHITAEPGEESLPSSSSAESMVTAEEYLEDAEEASTHRGENDQLEADEQVSQAGATGNVLKSHPITVEYLAQRKETVKRRSPETLSSDSGGPSAVEPRLQLSVKPRTTVDTWEYQRSQEEHHKTPEHCLKLSVRPRATVDSWKSQRNQEEHHSADEHPLKLSVRPRATADTLWASHGSQEEQSSVAEHTLKLSVRPRAAVDTPWESHLSQEKQGSATVDASMVAIEWKAVADALQESRRSHDSQEEHRGSIERFVSPQQARVISEAAWEIRRIESRHERHCDPIAGPLFPHQSRGLAEDNLEDRRRWETSQRRGHQANPISSGRPRWTVVGPPPDREERGHPPTWVAHPTAVNKPVLSCPQPTVDSTQGTQPQTTHNSARSIPPQPTIDTAQLTQHQLILDTSWITHNQPTHHSAQIIEPEPTTDTAQIIQSQPTQTIDTPQIIQLQPTIVTSHVTQPNLSPDTARAKRPKLTLDTALASRHQRLVGPPMGYWDEEESSSESDVDSAVTLGHRIHKSHDDTPKEYKTRSLNMNYLDDQLNTVLAEGHGARHRGPPQTPKRGLFPEPYKPRTPSPREDEDESPLHPMVVRRMRYRHRPGVRCNHEAVIRNFPAATGDRCDECGRQYRFHWMCVADTEEFEARDPGAQRRADISILNPWIIRAIEEGHYTDEQIDKLIEQKLDVLAAAAQDRNRETSPLKTSSSSSSDISLLEEMMTCKPPTQEALEAARVRRLEEEEFHARTAPCQLQACSNCHQNWEERAFESIDKIVNEPYQPLPNIPEYLNRPVSNAAVLRNAHWEEVTEMQEWWSYLTQDSDIDLSPILGIANRGGFTQAQTMQLVQWARNGRPTQLRFSNFVTWVESAKFTPSQHSHFFQMLSHSRLLRPRHRDITPNDSSSRQGQRFTFCVYEETEVRGHMVETPGYEYLLEDTIPGATSGFARFLQARRYRAEQYRAGLQQQLGLQESAACPGGSGNGSS